jgi:hypothetical protein
MVIASLASLASGLHMRPGEQRFVAVRTSVVRIRLRLEKGRYRGVRRFAFFTFTMLVIAYLLLAYVFILWPFKTRVSAPVPGRLYLVFVDTTASNSDRSNWSPEADQFAATLQDGDRVRFMIVDDKTSSNAEYGAELSIPRVDLNAGYPDEGIQLAAERKAKEDVRKTLQSLLSVRSSARVTDVLGIFRRLEFPPTAPVNSLVIFSDGQESAAGAGLDSAGEDGGAGRIDRINLETMCVNPGARPRLISAAQGFVGSSEITKVSDVTWVVPNRVGRAGCNSLPELREFWGGLIEALAQGGPVPRFRFETNPF